MYVLMRRLHIVLASTLVLLWVPITAHCNLETLPGLGFLNCCVHDEPKGCHGEEDCEADACAVVESGAYKVEDDSPIVPVPSLIAAFLLDECFIASELPEIAEVSALDPPETLHTWRFTHRAALPPRASSRRA